MAGPNRTAARPKCARCACRGRTDAAIGCGVSRRCPTLNAGDKLANTLIGKA
jgi:hypothetical protein